ncbi:MAG: hypothetical protein ACLPQY_24450 [Streptosporangiaceae bacterium]
MLDELAGKRTGERIQILREHKGPDQARAGRADRHVPSWLKGIERGTRLRHGCR